MTFKHNRSTKHDDAKRHAYRRHRNPKSLRAVALPKKPLTSTPAIRRHAARPIAPPSRVETLPPRVSIVMALCDASPRLEQCLEAVFAQDYPTGCMEFVIADGTKRKEMREKLMALQAEHANLIIVQNPCRTPAAGLNAAIRASSGEIIVRLDAHVVIESDYVRRAVNVLQQTGTDNAAGVMKVDREGPFGDALSAAMRSRFGIGGGMFPYYDESTRTFKYCGEEPRVDAVYLSAWRRDLFATVGLFDEELGRNHDDGINLRLLENRGRVVVSPTIRSVYRTRTTFASICRQYFDYGFWRVRLMQRHRWHMQPRQLVSPVMVAILLASLLLSPFSTIALAAFCGVAGVLFTGEVAASFLTARRAGWRQFPKLFATFAAMHLSFGAGFLSGLIRFARRWQDKGQFERLSLEEAAGTPIESRQEQTLELAAT